jgi:DNA-binding MarR family transcriptional regulator
MSTCRAGYHGAVDEPRWLDEHEARAWRGFISMQSQLLRRLSRELQRDSSLSEADFEVLVQLSEAPDGRQRLFELGRATQWEKSRLSHHLSRMAQRGLVVRETCPTDSRGAFVRLTEEGRAAIEEAAPKHVEHVRRWFIDVLGPVQLDTLAAISEKVLAGLIDEPDSCCAIDGSPEECSHAVDP